MGNVKSTVFCTFWYSCAILMSGASIVGIRLVWGSEVSGLWLAFLFLCLSTAFRALVKSFLFSSSLRRSRIV